MPNITVECQSRATLQDPDTAFSNDCADSMPSDQSNCPLYMQLSATKSRLGSPYSMPNRFLTAFDKGGGGWGKHAPADRHKYITDQL
jgi:hypothetical protein